MQMHNLLQEHVILIVLLMPNDIIGQQTFTFFGPLVDHPCSDSRFVAMVTLHGTTQTCFFRSRNHHYCIKLLFQTLLEN